ncbi:unnamed protein product [Ixodes pacificus]
MSTKFKPSELRNGSTDCSHLGLIRKLVSRAYFSRALKRRTPQGRGVIDAGRKAVASARKALIGQSARFSEAQLSHWPRRALPLLASPAQRSAGSRVVCFRSLRRSRRTLHSHFSTFYIDIFSVVFVLPSVSYVPCLLCIVHVNILIPPLCLAFLFRVLLPSCVVVLCFVLRASSFDGCGRWFGSQHAETKQKEETFLKQEDLRIDENLRLRRCRKSLYRWWTRLDQVRVRQLRGCKKKKKSKKDFRDN